MADIATIARIDEILAEYKVKKTELTAFDYTEAVEQQVVAFRESLMSEWKAKIGAQLREVEISIVAVERVKAKLLIEEEVENATTKQRDFTIQ